MQGLGFDAIMGAGMVSVSGTCRVLYSSKFGQLRLHPQKNFKVIGPLNPKP